MDRNKKGKVYLVGAGPGDGELLTLKGARLLAEADSVVYDRLVGQQILDMIPEEAEKIDVGKNAGNHPVPQDRINEILAEQAELGRVVVRLKGGDPFVFGRGGEELELLKKRGIEFEVVPGITSPVAGAAYAGIPVTHRDYTSSLHIITGHAGAGRELIIDFESLVKLDGTLVFMMSVSSVGKIAEGLLDAGMNPEMPCAVVERGTLPVQRKFVTALGSTEQVVRENSVESPALIIVGRVCTLSDEFDWFTAKPLFGKSVLVTQPEKNSSRLAEGLRKLGADVTLYPCIRTEAIRSLNIPEGDYDTLVFTSAEGVKSYCNHLLEDGQDMRALAGKKIACIGSVTAEALKTFGIIADFVPSVYSGRVLGEEMVSSRFVNKDSSLLLLRTNAASQDVTDELAKAEITYTDYPVYTTEIIRNRAISDIGSYAFITFTSKSCVTGFVQSQEKTSFDGIRAVCIGEQTGAAAAGYGFDIILSDEATIESMLELCSGLQEEV